MGFSRQEYLSMGFFRQEYQSGLPFPYPGVLPGPRMEPISSAMAGGFTTSESSWKPPGLNYKTNIESDHLNSNSHPHMEDEKTEALRCLEPYPWLIVQFEEVNLVSFPDLYFSLAVWILSSWQTNPYVWFPSLLFLSIYLISWSPYFLCKLCGN